jgi:hypothetical protein
MALRARIIPPPIDPTHDAPSSPVRWSAVRVSKVFTGDRRLEAETYLSSGYGIRLAIQGKGGSVQLEKLARIWMPGRLKGIQVGPENGTPFLASTQVFDVRPVPRKWLALARTSDAKRRFVEPGTILVTCSGSVGRATLASEVLRDTLISHDLLRVEAIDQTHWGWLYAFLNSPQARAMMTGLHYGQIIKHLEPEHLQAIPIPSVDRDTAADFQRRAKTILELRNKSFLDNAKAEQIFADALGPVKPTADKSGFSVRASQIFTKRRRLEANNHAPIPTAIRALFKNAKPLSAFTKKVWWMPRFKRFYGAVGLPYLSANELFSLNPPETKKIIVKSDDEHESYFVKRGWILMACSGQVYGLNGAAMLATEYHEGTFFSHDLIRIIPDESQIRAGYLLVTLTHPTHGRPLLIRAAYGTSIPHLDPPDVADFPVVRLGDAIEAEIANLGESSALARATADAMERDLSRDAGTIVDDFVHRPPVRLVSDAPQGTSQADEAEFQSLAAKCRVERPRGADIQEMAQTPAYRSIIRMGDRAVRPILLQLQREPEHWFHALNRITGENPVPPESEGKLRQMADAWVRWGKARGYIDGDTVG